jgi:hypothetical protein
MNSEKLAKEIERQEPTCQFKEADPEGLVRMFLARLRRIVWVRDHYDTGLTDDAGRALNKAAYSLWADCRNLGYEEQANLILGRTPEVLCG